MLFQMYKIWNFFSIFFIFKYIFCKIPYKYSIMIHKWHKILLNEITFQLKFLRILMFFINSTYWQKRDDNTQIFHISNSTIIKSILYIKHLLLFITDAILRFLLPLASTRAENTWLEGQRGRLFRDVPNNEIQGIDASADNKIFHPQPIKFKK